MNRIQIKEKAKQVIKENRMYYFALMLVPSLLIVFQSISSIIGSTASYQTISQNLSNITDISSTEQMSNLLSQLPETSSLEGNIVFSIIFGLLMMSVRMVMLKSYRHQNDTTESGIKDTFYIFRKNQWVAAIFLWILDSIYLFFLEIGIGIILAIAIVILILPLAFIKANAWALVLIAIITIVVLAIVALIIIVCRNFTSQMSYLFLDNYKETGSFTVAFTRSFSLMTKKRNAKEYIMLQATFIGWSLLNMVTLGLVGLFYSNAYIEMSYAGFYEDGLEK